MIQGKTWKLLDKDGLSKIGDAAFSLLTKRGVEVQHEDMLWRLEGAGCKVDKLSRRVFFNEKLLREAPQAFGSQSRDTNVNIPYGWTPAQRVTNTTGSYPHFLDWPSCQRRLATVEDIVNNAKMAHVLPEFETVGKAMTCFEIDQRVEPIWSIATIMGITNKAIGGGEVFYPEHIKHLIRLGEIYSGTPGDTRFVAACDFCIPPLVFTERMIGCMIEKSKYHVTHVPGTMVISGCSGPVTIAGTAALALAELIAGWTIYYLIDPTIPADGIVCTGSLDMRTTRASFGSPESMLQDMTVVQAVKYLYGTKIGAAHAYVDCKVPGIQAVFEKMLPLLAFPFEGNVDFHTGGILSAGEDYSPVEQILELDMRGAIDRVLGTYEVSDETLALDLFEPTETGGNMGFLDKEHTLRHFKNEHWYPKWLNRQIWQGNDAERHREQKMMEEIDAYWKDAVRRYEPPEIDRKRLAEAKTVLKVAETEKVSLKV